jgi:hypothetical protein
MTRSEINEYVRNCANSIYGSQFQAFDDNAAKFVAFVVFVVPIVIGFFAGILWGAGLFAVLFAVLHIGGSLDHIAFAKDLEARSRALQAVASLRASDDPS